MDEVEILKIVPHIIKSKQNKLFIDYDEDADVVYINFRDPPFSVEHEEDENGVVKNFDRASNLVGFTVIGAKRFIQ